MFSKSAFIEDPVGAPRHLNLSRFYDTFIALHDITFVEKGDWVDEERRIVYRAVDIHIVLVDGYGIQVQPATLKYAFNEELKVESLEAHWSALRGCKFDLYGLSVQL